MPGLPTHTSRITTVISKLHGNQCFNAFWIQSLLDQWKYLSDLFSVYISPSIRSPQALFTSRQIMTFIYYFPQVGYN